MRASEKVRTWREAYGMNTRQAADRIGHGVKRQNIEQFEAGGVENPRYAIYLAKAMRLTVEQLFDPHVRWTKPMDDADGNAVAQDETNGYNRETQNEPQVVPVLSSPPPVRLVVAEPSPPYGANTAFTQPVGQVGEHGYALRVKGPSMVNPSSGPSFPDGSLIFVNPQIEPRPGHFVVGVQPGVDGFLFKKLIEDAGRHYLESLNPKFDLLPMDDQIELRGVVVGMGLDDLYG